MNRPAALALLALACSLISCAAPESEDEQGGILDSPVSVAYANGHVFVSNANYDLSGAGEGFLLVVDARAAVRETDKNRAVVGKRTTTAYITGLAVDAERNRVYVADRDENEVAVFDVSDPTDPREIDQDPVAGGVQGLRAGKEPYGLAFRPDGRFLYVANNASGDVSVIDLESRRLARSISLASGVVFAAMRPGTDELWVTNRRLGTVSVIDTRENDFVVSFQAVQPDAALASDTRGIAFTADGKKAYVAIHNPAMVAVVDPSLLPDEPEHAVRAYIPMHSSPYGLALSPDGRELWCSNYNSKRILIVDTDTDVVRDMVRLGRGPTELAMVQFPEDDPAQFYVFVPHFFGHSMAVIDGVTKQNLGAIR